METYLYKVNVTWTSPYFSYTPQNQWNNGVTRQSDSIAAFAFRGKSIKLFGSTNATYTTQLDNGTSQPANPRWFNYTSGEIPSNLACNSDTPWGCVVMAEYHDLDTSGNHTLTLQSNFDASSSNDLVSILGMQVIHDTGLSNQTAAQTNEVPMEDTRLVYQGTWKNITYDPSIYRVSSAPGSTITFPFSGYAIYVWGTTDVYTSKFSVTLDGQSHNMPVPSSGFRDPNCLLWYRAGLDQDSRHTIVVTNTETTGLVIKGFTVVRLVDTLNPGESLAPTTRSRRLSTGAIAGISAGIVLIFLIAGVASFLYCRIRRGRVQFEKGAHSSMPSVQQLMGTSTPSSSRFGRVTPWEAPNTPVSGPSQTSPSSVPPIPNYPPPRIDETTSPSSSASTRKPAMAYGTTSPIAGSSREGAIAGQHLLVSAQSPMSPGFNSSRQQTQQYQQPAAAVYGIEHHKPPLDLDEPSLGTPLAERRVDVYVTSPSSSVHGGQSGSERGPGSAGGSRQAMLGGSDMVQTDVIGVEGQIDRSATPPPAYEYRAQPGASSRAAQDQEAQEREQRREEERRRRRDAKTASGSGLALANEDNV